jgi:hypothetical protein
MTGSDNALPEVALHTTWSLVASVVGVAVTAVVLRSSPRGSTAATT